MKKLLTLALCSIMVLGLGSCGKKNSSSNPISSNPDTTQTSTPDSSSEESSDTGTSDTGSTDSGSTDSGSTDSGSSDSGSTDSGSSDTGSSDSGSTDSGSSDSGSSDTGDSNSETITIYFQNNWGWSYVKAYLFDSTGVEGSNHEVEWPGKPMEIAFQDGINDDLKDVYELVIDLSQPYDYVVFNGFDSGKIDEKHPEGQENKSPDIAIDDVMEGDIFYMDYKNNANQYGFYQKAYTSYTIEVDNTDVTTTAAVTDTQGYYAKFSYVLEANQVVTIKGDSKVLYTYTATEAGEQTFVINNKNRGELVAPVDPNADKNVYFIPDAQWASDGARYAAYFFGGATGDAWVNLSDEDADGTYQCETVEGYTNVIFCRMKGTASENNWDNKWNQTVDLEVNLGKTWTMTNPWDSANDYKATGSWSE